MKQPLSSLFAASVMTLGLCAVARAEDPKRIDVDVSDTELGAVMQQIAKAAGVTINVAPEVAKEQVSVSLRQIPWDEAVEVIARMTACEVERRGGVLHVLRIPKVTLAGRDLGVQGVLKTIAAAGKMRLTLGPKVRGNIALDLKRLRWRDALAVVAYTAGLDVRRQKDSLEIKARTAPGRSAPPKLAPRGAPVKTTPRDKKVSVSYKDVDLSEAMERLGQQVGRNILVDPDVAARLTLELKDTAWTEVAKRAARLTKSDVEVRPGGILLFTQAPKNRIRAVKAPAEAFFLTLARTYAKQSVVVAPEVRAQISCDLKQVYWRKALRTVARAHKYKVVRFPGDAIAIVGATFDPKARRPARGSVDPMQLVKAKLQALFAPPEFDGRPPLVLIAGRAYREGQKLRDADGAELPLRVARIRAATVELRARPGGKTVIKFE